MNMEREWQKVRLQGTATASTVRGTVVSQRPWGRCFSVSGCLAKRWNAPGVSAHVTGCGWWLKLENRKESFPVTRQLPGRRGNHDRMWSPCITTSARKRYVNQHKCLGNGTAWRGCLFQTVLNGDQPNGNKRARCEMSMGQWRILSYWYNSIQTEPMLSNEVFVNNNFFPHKDRMWPNVCDWQIWATHHTA